MISRRKSAQLGFERYAFNLWTRPAPALRPRALWHASCARSSGCRRFAVGGGAALGARDGPALGSAENRAGLRPSSVSWPVRRAPCNLIRCGSDRAFGGAASDGGGPALSVELVSVEPARVQLARRTPRRRRRRSRAPRARLVLENGELKNAYRLPKSQRPLPRANSLRRLAVSQRRSLRHRHRRPRWTRG